VENHTDVSSKQKEKLHRRRTLTLITQSEALKALNEAATDEQKFSIVGNPDDLGPVTVYFVRVWEDEDVDFRDVMFHRKNGKVKVYAGNN
jgi:hypothetical protein